MYEVIYIDQVCIFVGDNWAGEEADSSAYIFKKIKRSDFFLFMHDISWFLYVSTL